ncbi:hypothetical protein AB0G32_03935 [Streptomyces sp. NPDC023723]|uniref:hypothetical protein n=1 Tax=Streptomyces sp. NPDC023723 TaxID=3154323 RepID=UPI0033F03F6E
MATGTSNSPQQAVDTYARLAHLLHTLAAADEALFGRVYEELLTLESHAYAAGWTDALTATRQTGHPCVLRTVTLR